MILLLVMSGLVGLLLAVKTVTCFRSSIRFTRKIMAGLFLTAATVGAFAVGLWAYGSIQDNEANPTREKIVAQLRACTTPDDNASVLAALKAARFPADLSSHSYPSEYNSVYLPPDLVAQSASYISFMTDRVRSESVNTSIFNTPERLDVVFLFDSQGKLLTWSYGTYSPSL